MSTRPPPHIGSTPRATQQPEPSNPLGWAWTPEQRDHTPELHRRLDAYAEHARWSHDRIAYLESRIRDLGAIVD